MINQTDIAYAAGVFDSEGTIYIANIGKFKQLKVTIFNTNEQLMKWFKEKFGGIVGGPYVRKHLQRKPQWAWTISVSRGAEIFLRLIKDYCIEKKEKCQEGIDFCEKYKPRASIIKDPAREIRLLKHKLDYYRKKK